MPTTQHRYAAISLGSATVALADFTAAVRSVATATKTTARDKASRYASAPEYGKFVHMEIAGGVFSMVATDGHRMHVVEFDVTSTASDAVNVDPKPLRDACKRLGRKGTVRIIIGATCVEFVTDTVQTTIAAIPDSHFPDWHRLVNDLDPAGHVDVDCTVFAEALRPVAMIAKHALPGGHTVAIYIDDDGDSLNLATYGYEADSEAGPIPTYVCRRHRRLSEDRSGREAIAVDARLLLPAVEAAGPGTLRLEFGDTPLKPLVLRKPGPGPRRYFILMPQRLEFTGAWARRTAIVLPEAA